MFYGDKHIYDVAKNEVIAMIGPLWQVNIFKVFKPYERTVEVAK